MGKYGKKKKRWKARKKRKWKIARVSGYRPYISTRLRRR